MRYFCGLCNYDSVVICPVIPINYDDIVVSYFDYVFNYCLRKFLILANEYFFKKITWTRFEIHVYFLYLERLGHLHFVFWSTVSNRFLIVKNVF
jgi:hypothetical protein